jgi:hypothetical protein
MHSPLTLEVPLAQPLVTPRLLAGKVLDRRSWPKDPTASAFLALDLVAGHVVAAPLTPDQALYLTGANWCYFSVARTLAPWERAEVEAGRVSLCAFVQGRRKTS